MLSIIIDFKEHCQNMFSSIANYFTISLMFYKHGTQITAKSKMDRIFWGIKKRIKKKLKGYLLFCIDK